MELQVNDVKLNPCPFCGSDNISPERLGQYDYVWVECYDCGAQGPSKETNREILDSDEMIKECSERVIELWNERK